MSGPPSREDGESAGRVVYSLGSSPAERDRLRRQSGELRDHSALLLDRVGVAAEHGLANVEVIQGDATQQASRRVLTILSTPGRC